MSANKGLEANLSSPEEWRKQPFTPAGLFLGTSGHQLSSRVSFGRSGQMPPVAWSSSSSPPQYTCVCTHMCVPRACSRMCVPRACSLADVCVSASWNKSSSRTQNLASRAPQLSSIALSSPLFLASAGSMLSKGVSHPVLKPT